MRLFLSEKIVLDEYFYDGGILVGDDGKILEILNRIDAESIIRDNGDVQIIDVGTDVLMSGIIDSHVHINEPGRTDWEGFETATKAAAAGGITTIVDMPLNSVPPTTTVENLKIKVNATKGKLHVDVAFWGGVVPSNENELIAMVDAGVVGFKCFLCPSGVEEFNRVNFDDVEKALRKLESTNSVLAFHAELEKEIPPSNGDPTCYETFLETRPPSMETRAIEKVIELSAKYNVRTHIVHLSAATAIPSLEEAKQSNPKISVETCHHYLSLNSEAIPRGCTQFKCCPPIRNTENQNILWEALRRNVITMVVSDHSPSTPDLKLLNVGENCGNFLKAWGGISSLQFGLSLFWTASRQKGFTIFDINKCMSRATAQLVGLHNRKGKIMKNYDADFVIWDPLAPITITEDMIQHKNKITPYLGKELTGKVIKTVVRGHVVYDHRTGFSLPEGNALVNKQIFQ